MKTTDELRKELAALEGRPQGKAATLPEDIDPELAAIIDLDKNPIQPEDRLQFPASATEDEIRRSVIDVRKVLYYLSKPIRRP